MNIYAICPYVRIPFSTDIEKYVANGMKSIEPCIR